MVNENAVGTLWLERSYDDAENCDLGILIFDSAQREQGIGKAAIQLALREATDAWQIKQVRLRVRESNARAISCYKSCGFHIVGTSQKMIGGEVMQVLLMEKNFH